MHGAPHPTNLLTLFHYRWVVPVLAELERDEGCRFATLSKRLGVPRETLRTCLGYMEGLEIVMPNPGYGHPVRPEYVLGTLGSKIGGDCLWLMDWLRDQGLEAACMKKWPLPTLLAIAGRVSATGGGGEAGARFGELAAIMLGVSPRALSTALDALGEARLAERLVVDGRPPGTLYRVSDKGRELVPVLTRLAVAVGV